MTSEELQQIQAIIQAAIEPLAIRLGALEQGQQQLTAQIATVETALRGEIQAAEQHIIKRVDDLEKLSADYQDREIRQLRRRVKHIEQHLQIAPAE